MFHVLMPLPKLVTVACSAGVDSMAVLDFLSRSHHVQVAYFNHGTSHGDACESWIQSYCAQKGLDLILGRMQHEKFSHESMEAYWRRARYEFLHAIDQTVIMAHHLDDCVETYLFNCVHGKHHTIPLRNRNVVRPFLTTPKSEFESWCARKAVPHVTDPSNSDVRHMRNLIRHQIVPEALKVNPGLRTVVKKLVLDSLGK
jgi:tRNA(Ile)-lysidine synthase